MNLAMTVDMPPVLFPELLARQIDGDGVTLDLSIPADLSYFDGHFQQIAIVPGVVQIQWAVHFARLYLPLFGCFSHMEAIKFKELLLPAQPFQLRLHYQRQSNKLTFAYCGPAGEYSTGRLYFAELPVPSC